MIFKNTWALLILAFLAGIATNLGFIGSQSYLLSQAPAVYTVYGGIIGGLLFSWFLQNFHLIKLRYAHFSALSIALYSLCLAALTQNWLNGLPKAIAWFLVSMFGVALLRWIISELTIRYLDPARANSYFAYLNAFCESGTVLVIVLTKIYGLVMNPNQTLDLILVCCLASLALIVMQFFPARNFEIVYSKAGSETQETLPSTLRPLMICFILMSACFAAIAVNETYLLKLVLKDRLQSYQAIRAVTDNYFLLSCALIVLLSFVTGKAIGTKRISPLKLLNTYSAVMIGFGTFCLATNALFLFVAFEVARRLCEYCLYSPATQIIMGSFVSELRPKVRAQHSFYFFVLVPTVLAGVFSLTSRLPVRVETVGVIGLVLLSSLAAVVTVLRFRALYTRFLYELIESGSKSAAIIAAHTLSYIRPKDYVERMSRILARDPKKLLRKTIVLGLAYTGTDDSVELIQNEFYSDKEEIQLAAIDALRISGRLRATKFMLNILLERARPKTQRVRLNALTAIGALYGRKAIPFVLIGLEDDDPRTVANALEVLSYFGEKELIATFMQFVNSNVPRQKANALLGLSRFSETREDFVSVIRESLSSGDVPLVASLLYIIGKTKAKEFRAEVLKIYNNTGLRYDQSVINPLAWALARLNEKSGFDLAIEILSVPDSTNIAAYMHFFSQLDAEARYDVIKHFVNRNAGDLEASRRLGEILKNSVYDFHEELQYLSIYSQSVPSAMRHLSATAV